MSREGARPDAAGAVRAAEAAGAGAVRAEGPRRWSVPRGVKRVYPILVLVLAWQVVSQSGPAYATLFPPPARVLSTMVSMVASGALLQDILATLYRLGVGYLIALGGGFLLAAAMARYPAADDFWSPIIDLVGPIPDLAWAPFAILWFGLGNAATIFIIALGGIFPVIWNSLAGLRSVNRVIVSAARSLGTGEVQLFYRILIPAAVPHILTGARMGLQRGWRALVAGEMIAAARHGLGFMIFDAREFMQTAVMMVGLITIGVLGYLIEAVVFRMLERRTIVRWGMSGAGLQGGR